MKRVLCYGDSNTWGYIPGTGKRYDCSVRWPMLLQNGLKEEFTIIEEGLRGRTTVFDDHLVPGRNGLTYLTPCLQSHAPLDLLVLMLGTNDRKTRFNLTVEEIASGLERLLRTIKCIEAGNKIGETPRILVLSPPSLGEIPHSQYAYRNSVTKDCPLASEYRDVADRNGCDFFDIESRLTAGGSDGIHLTAEDHKRVAYLLTEQISKLFSRSASEKNLT
jgi:lysophospholipase L1-like esterase